MPHLIFDAVVFAHAFGPWVVASRRLFAGLKLEPPPDTPAKTDRKSEPVKVEHQTLRCTNCGASVPLADESFPCPYCRATVVPSPAVVRARRRVEWAKRALVRAERAWKRAVLWNAPIWVFLFGVCFCASSAGVFYYVLAVADGIPNDLAAWPKVGIALSYMAAPSVILGWWIGAQFAGNAFKMPKVLGNVPKASFVALPLAHVKCSNCGADIDFANGRLGAICEYCGSEEIRPSLAGRATKEARSLEGAARRSIIDAHRATTERREMMLSFIDLMAILQILGVIGGLLDKIPYLGALLELFG